MQQVNQKRVKNLLAGVKDFGLSDKGVTRLAYTDLDFAAQAWLLEQVKDLNLTVTEDAVGNTFLRRPGIDNSLPPIAMGSHLDTVIQAGAYDGIVGVVGALEALYMLRDEKLTAPVEIIIFKAEESSRFGYATMGSKLMTGSATPEQLSQGTKKNDKSFVEVLRENGYNPDNYAEAIKKPGYYKCFLEIHIEQGKVLDETGEQIGIVHNIAAPTRFKIIVDGMADHSGATPMGFRKDALVAGAKLILAVQKAAEEEASKGTVATVGVVDVEPSSINVVPGKVTLWVDLRGVDNASIAKALDKIQHAMANVVDSDKVIVSQEMLTADKPVALSDDLAYEFAKICEEMGVKYRHMNSGAGHDAMHMVKLAPTSMLFIPCKEGISHNPAEYAKLEDICVGVEVLAKMVKKIAQ
ncbi:MAG: Zn-dependent hydrolase [Acholeplasmataceae bacterium]|nr:Zn-dependent hydrolase [Acholeplasmataceae bacterium]